MSDVLSLSVMVSILTCKCNVPLLKLVSVQQEKIGMQ